MSVRVVASADACEAEKILADYVCDGVDDQVEIQQAIDTVSREGEPS